MCYKTLPEEYTPLDKIDLQHNKKQFWIVQGLGFALLAVMATCGYFIESTNFILGSTEHYVALAVLIIGFIIYIILHEATHALFMYSFVKAKLNFGFKVWAAYAGSTAYYDKKHYIVIALAPVVIWGLVFGALNVVFNSGGWFWVIWILQIANVSGASGDLYCTFKMLKYPKDILVCDSGMDMMVFRRKTAEEIEAEKVAEATENYGEEASD